MKTSRPPPPAPPEKSHPLFISNPPLKVKVLSSPPPLFENLVGGSIPPADRGKGGAPYGFTVTLTPLGGKSFLYPVAPASPSDNYINIKACISNRAEPP